MEAGGGPLAGGIGPQLRGTALRSSHASSGATTGATSRAPGSSMWPSALDDEVHYVGEEERVTQETDVGPQGEVARRERRTVPQGAWHSAMESAGGASGTRGPGALDPVEQLRDDVAASLALT